MKGLARHSTCECRCGGRPASAPDVPPAMNPVVSRQSPDTQRLTAWSHLIASNSSTFRIS
jgi:hypothetical protein